MSVVLGIMVKGPHCALLVDSAYEVDGTRTVRRSAKMVQGKDWVAAVAGDEVCLQTAYAFRRKGWGEMVAAACDAGDCEMLLIEYRRGFGYLYHVDGNGNAVEVQAHALVPDRELERGATLALVTLSGVGSWYEFNLLHSLLVHLAPLVGAVPPFWVYSTQYRSKGAFRVEAVYKAKQ